MLTHGSRWHLYASENWTKMIVAWTFRDTFRWNLTLTRALGPMLRHDAAIVTSNKIGMPIKDMSKMTGKQ